MSPCFLFGKERRLDPREWGKLSLGEGWRVEKCHVVLLGVKGSHNLFCKCETFPTIFHKGRIFFFNSSILCRSLEIAKGWMVSEAKTFKGKNYLNLVLNSWTRKGGFLKQHITSFSDKIIHLL